MEHLQLDQQILFCAFRYALGRQTYVVSDVSDTIIHQWDNLITKYQRLIQVEIKEAIADNRAGHQMDIDSWSRILELKETTICPKKS